MENPQSVQELIASARANAQALQARIDDAPLEAGDQVSSDAQSQEVRAAYIALESLAVDIFGVFEARMQHHFRRGPFSRKLKALLVDAGLTDLAERFHQYYLAVNVLKHGTGASYRELRDMPEAIFPVLPAESLRTGEQGTPTGLVDVGISGFFDGLAATLTEAHQFLENQ